MVSFNPLTWFRSEQKASAAGHVVSGHNVGKPVWTERDYLRLAEEGYVRNAIGYRCVAMIAQAVASVPFMLMDGDKEVENSDLLKLLANPAPNTSLSWLIESCATYLQLSGNAYIDMVGPERTNAAPRELWSLRPDRMKVIAGSQGMPQGYVYESGGKKVTWDVDPITGQSKIVHFKRFHPTDDWYGLSVVEPAAYGIDRHNEAGAHNMAVLQNGAVPSGALILKPVTQDGKSTSAPQPVIDAAQARLEELYSGSKNSGKPMVLGGNVDWKTFGLNMEELQLTGSKLDAAQDICIAMGVPIDLVLPGQSTYNNKREAKLALYEETVMPLHELITGGMNASITPRFGENLKLQPNLDEVKPLSLRREIRQTNTTKLFDSGLISRDESRGALQFEAEPDMPQYKVDSAVLSSLVTAAQKDSIMFIPLFNYMRSVGLVDRAMTLETFMEDGGAMIDALGDGDDPDALPPKGEGNADPNSEEA